MVAVFSAMGLFNVSDSPPDPKRMERTRKWSASRMVPFSARMVVEKLACGGKDDYAPHRKPWRDEDVSENDEALGGCVKEGEDEQYVRIFVNDALQPLEFCHAMKGGRWEGMCSLKEFVKSQGYARRNGDGDFEKCYT